MDSDEVRHPGINEYESLDNYNSKPFIIHIIQLFIASALLSYLSVIDYSSYTYYWLAKTFQLLAFGGLGIVHIHYLKKQILFINSELSSKSLWVTLQLFAFVFVVLFILYYLLATNMLLMSLYSSCAFLLPPIIFYSWLNFKTFPEPQYKVWNNFEKVSNNPVTIYLNSIRINVRLTKKYFDIEEQVFLTTLPEDKAFGKLFNQFLLGLNEEEPIEFLDEKQKPYGWIFFVESIRGYGKRYIDPDMSLEENNVKENSTIVAKRVKKEVELEVKTYG